MPNASGTLRRFRFDQLATQVNDRVDDPAASGVERYVGLEHLDADSLSIRRWGEITDVESTKLRFQPGDIIFGKRRVYQRKLAVADFEGICSAHAMVLRAKPDVVDPGFLPYFMQSDLFMERALSISVGSLSPTINWKDLAQQEFALPPIEEQRRIVFSLIAIEEASERVYLATRACGSCMRSFLADALDPCKRSWPVATIGERFATRGGGTPSRDRPEYWGVDVPWLSSSEVCYGEIGGTAERISLLGLSESSACLIPPGSVIVAMFGATRARSAIASIELSTNQACLALLPNSEHDEWFTYAWLRREEGRLFCQGRGAAQPNLNAAIIRSCPFPVVPYASQRAIGRTWQQFEAAERAMATRRSAIRALAGLVLRGEK
jgi:type I restriction enzyme S subunit